MESVWKRIRQRLDYDEIKFDAASVSIYCATDLVPATS